MVMFLHKESTYTIKPNPLADLIRSKALRENTILHVKNKLLSFMPYTIVKNISSLIEYSDIGTKNILKDIIDIWTRLNSDPVINIKYFQALRLLIDMLSQYDKKLK